jgi:hypothetical protein
MNPSNKIFVGIDDTDIIGSRGTNQLARAIVQALADRFTCSRIVRHQLLDDPRVPYTSKNGSASMTLQPIAPPDIASLIETCRDVMREWFIEGSDPGLCVVANGEAATVSAFGRRCQQKVVTQQDAQELAAASGIHLEGLGGTNGGIIGALAAVGLAVTEDDGRVIQLGDWPDDLYGPQPLATIRERGVEVLDIDTNADIDAEFVDLVKRLRPNVRRGKCVLFVRQSEPGNQASTYHALKLP